MDDHGRQRGIDRDSWAGVHGSSEQRLVGTRISEESVGVGLRHCSVDHHVLTRRRAPGIMWPQQSVDVTKTDRHWRWPVDCE